MCSPRIVDRETRVFFSTNICNQPVRWVASEASARRLWATCPKHGRVVPKHDRLKSLAWPVCSICEAHAPMIAIDIRKPAPGKARSVCGGACLSGQRSCDCQCSGRCHGAGKCYCGRA